MELSQIINSLVSEIKLTEIQSKIFLHIVINGKMNASKLSSDLNITLNEAISNSRKLVDLGGFIDMPNDEFETMHPRFTAVNMYRRMCEREQITFKKNLKVDNIGVVLERSYDAARTK